MSAIKLITAASLCLAVMPALASQTIACISENNAFTRCDLSQADQRHVRLYNVTSGSCDTSGAWGVDSTSVWVSKGCGAVFQYNQLTSTRYSNGGNVIIEPNAIQPYYYDYGPDYEYPYTAVFFGSGYYHNGYYHNGYYHNGYHNGHYHGGGYHGGGHR
jgi:hypothetical protein